MYKQKLQAMPKEAKEQIHGPNVDHISSLNGSSRSARKGEEVYVYVCVCGWCVRVRVCVDDGFFMAKHEDK